MTLQVNGARSQQESYEKLMKVEHFYAKELQQKNHNFAGLAASKLRDLRRYKEAYQRLEEAIAQTPKHADLYTHKGQFMMLDAMCDRLCN